MACPKVSWEEIFSPFSQHFKPFGDYKRNQRVVEKYKIKVHPAPGAGCSLLISFHKHLAICMVGVAAGQLTGQLPGH